MTEVCETKNFSRKSSTKGNYHSNLNINNIRNNKKFWKAVKPSFTDKIDTTEQITSLEKDKNISDKHNIVETMENNTTLKTLRGQKLL